MRLSSESQAKGAWALCGLTVMLAAARLGLAIADSGSPSPLAPGGGLLTAAFEALVLTLLGLIGAVVATRMPSNVTGWVLSAIPFFLGVLIVGTHAYWSSAFEPREGNGAAQLTAWLTSWIWIPAVVPALPLFLLLFPTGRPLTPRWRWIGWMAMAAGVALLIGTALAPGRIEGFPTENPLGVRGVLEAPVEAIGGLGFALMIVATFTSAIALVVRFRRSHGAERQQLKLVAAAAVLFVFIFVFPTDVVVGKDAGFASILLGLFVVAGAVAIAMLRYRLYDIDVVINRALVYGALSATLAGAYLACVLVLQQALRPLTQDFDLAIAGSTLAVSALFRPVRSRIQSAVDRRFYRRRYDAAMTLERFSEHLRHEVALDSLSAELRAVAAETMQPAHVSLWLRTPSDAGVTSVRGR